MLSKNLVSQCQSLLLAKKEELMERLSQLHQGLYRSETTGDEGDFGNKLSEEITNLGVQSMLRSELLNIEMALHRIENGSFGICQETGDSIEEGRLLLMPWTQHSIEGAEAIEARLKTSFRKA